MFFFYSAVCYLHLCLLLLILFILFVYKTKEYIYVLIELIYYIIKELEITDAVVFQTACIAQDDFFYVAPFKKSLCKIGLAEISNIEFAKTRANFFYIIHLQFSVKMNLLLLVKVLFRSSLKDEL